MQFDVSWIAEGLKKPGKSKGGLAKAIGRSSPVVTSILKGERILKAHEVAIIARYLGVEAPGASEGPGREAVPSGGRLVEVPVIGVTEAGAFRIQEDIYQDEPEMIAVPVDAEFSHARMTAWDVAGDSMNALKPRPIFPGDRVIGINFEDLDNRVPLRDGMVVVVQQIRDGGHILEWSVKQVELYEDRIEFHPRSTNPRHKPIVVKRDLWADDGREVSILAIVRRVTNEFSW